MGRMRDDEASGGTDLKAVSAATYAATADHLDHPALSFWDRFGRRTVARSGVRPGQRIFDACCGTGACAIPAARIVDNHGQVLGFDLAEPALVLARG